MYALPSPVMAREEDAAHDPDTEQWNDAWRAERAALQHRAKALGIEVNT